VYYASGLLFGGWALAFNGGCLALGAVWRGPRAEAAMQRVIRRRLAWYLGWLRWVGAVRVEYRGWERARVEGAVIVANHPGLLDAFYLLARVPQGFCIFKAALGRNPLLGAAAHAAGYVANDSGIELVRGGTERLRRGATLVVFPEGTRTAASGEMGSLRAGFALIARRAGAPVQLMRIHAGSRLLGKGDAWWRVPRLPVRVVVEVGPCLEAAAFDSTKALVAAVEAWFRAGELRGELTHRAVATLTMA